MPDPLYKECRHEADHAFVVLNRHHFAYAVHAQDGFADVDSRNPEHRRDGRSHGRSARHVVAHHEGLVRHLGLLAEHLEPGIRKNVAGIALL